MKPYYADDTVTLHHGDALEVLRALPDASVDAVVTDPPYGLEFMGKDWDSFKPAGKISGFGAPDGSKFRQNMGTPSWGATGNPTCRNCGGDKYRNGDRKCRCDAPDFPNHMADQMRLFQQWCQQWATECLRVLKPGGHLLAFGGTRTVHRLTCAVEDAGFEVRDGIDWLYASGFPKSLDVSKAIDKAAGAQREVIRPRTYALANDGGYSGGLNTNKPRSESAEITAPATDDAARWAGWGTALKPAREPIVVARKPLAGTVAGNVLAYGTSALNIDACRVEGQPGESWNVGPGGGGFTPESYERGIGRVAPGQGRWPSNVVLSHAPDCGGQCVPGCPVAELDRQSGVLTSGTGAVKRASAKGGDRSASIGAESRAEGTPMLCYGDSGGASRFFPVFRYEAKAPTAERPRTPDGTAHPTVKPLDLMRWLVRLVTPPGGVVLEPFAGSGTTAEACVLEGFRCIAIEREVAYLPLIVARLTKPLQPSLDLFGAA